MKSLIGKTINHVMLDQNGQHVIVFVDVDYLNSVWAFIAKGGCCSETWFSDIIGIDALLGHTVTGVEELELPNYNTRDGRCRQRSDKVYGYKLTTEAGVCDVIFRNSSNGYYGGSVRQLDELATRQLYWHGYQEITKDYPC